MRGSLDQPPIVLRTDRRRALLRLLVLAVFASILSPVARTDWMSNGWAWTVIGIFGLLALASLWELVWPGRLVITPEGIELRDLWRRGRWTWAEARWFRPAANRFYRFVGFDDAREPSRRGGAINDLNQDWELAPADLAELLNRARARWVKNDARSTS